MNLEGKKVFVGLSGGVDSAVSAARLKAQGYQVTGVFIKVWHPDFLVCNWEAERLDAMRVAAHLDIPFLTCDAEEAYRDDVAQYFISEYIAGRTPNPDVFCNQYVKFGAFLRFALERGADYIATGHYARRIDGGAGPELHRGVDAGKDQTYFLWSLSSEQLARALFPVGNSAKEVIRKEAEELGLPVATKKDSQGVCFLGHIDIPAFLSHYTNLVPGDVLNEQGEKIGEHQGSLVYTLGQRHGFELHTKDINRPTMYVVAKDMEHNTITVASHRPLLPANQMLTLRQTVLRKPVKVGDRIEAQFRYRQIPEPVEVVEIVGVTLVLKSVHAIERTNAGQSCVLYLGTHCIGGGIMQ